MIETAYSPTEKLNTKCIANYLYNDVMNFLDSTNITINNIEYKTFMKYIFFNKLKNHIESLSFPINNKCNHIICKM